MKATHNILTGIWFVIFSAASAAIFLTYSNTNKIESHLNNEKLVDSLNNVIFVYEFMIESMDEKLSKGREITFSDLNSENYYLMSYDQEGN